MNETSRYSNYYLQRAGDARDSEKFRARLAAALRHHRQDVREDKDLIKHIELATGALVPVGIVSLPFDRFVATQTVSNVLDTITVVYEWLGKHRPEAQEEWKQFVSKCFEEEALGYRLTPACAVRHLVDQEYERNRMSLLECLKAPKWRAVESLCDAAFASLEHHPQDTKAAVRNVFEAAETLCKLILESGRDLDAKLVGAEIRAWTNKRIAGDHGSAQQAVGRMVSSFAKWADAGHPFRHGHAVEEPIAPSLDFAVLYLSHGASFIRWLAGMSDAEAK